MLGIVRKRGKFGHRCIRRTPCEDRDTQTQKENSHVKMEAKMGVSCYKPRCAWGFQKLAKARKDPSLEALEG